jgi:hypothetical protein
LLFGGKFLKLNVGNAIQLTPVRYMNDVWAGMMTAWGVPTTNFGNDSSVARGYCKGPAPGVFL